MNAGPEQPGRTVGERSNVGAPPFKDSVFWRVRQDEKFFPNVFAASPGRKRGKKDAGTRKGARRRKKNAGREKALDGGKRTRERERAKRRSTVPNARDGNGREAFLRDDVNRRYFATSEPSSRQASRHSRNGTPSASN